MNKNFKVVLISNTSHFFSSFMLNHIHELSKIYSVSICCNNADKLKKKVPSNISLININYVRGFSLINDLFAFLFTLFFFLKNKPNLSISFTPKIGLMVTISSFFARTPKRIHWFTGQIWANSEGLARIFFKSLDKLIYYLSDYVFIDGLSQRKFLIKEKIISRQNSIVFNKGSVGGVNISKFKYNDLKRSRLRKNYSIAKNTFVFLYLGRINKDKGIIELVDAFNNIKNMHNVLLVIVGSLEDKKIEQLVKNKNKILYFNYTDKPEEWLSLADVLCLPSHREGFGTVVIEAASCGIPSLCSNIYGLQDALIKDKTGFFHKVGNTNDIKKKMLYIVRNKKLVKKYGQFANKRVLKDFEQSVISKKFLKFISSNILRNGI